MCPQNFPLPRVGGGGVSWGEEKELSPHTAVHTQGARFSPTVTLRGQAGWPTPPCLLLAARLGIRLPVSRLCTDAPAFKVSPWDCQAG